MRSATTTPTSAPGVPLPVGSLSDFDWMRGLAACAVVVGHVRGLFLVDYAEVAAPSNLLRGLYVLFGLGHQAVIVFFVLSGFFIGHSVLTARAAGRFSFGAYALRRVTRLYVVLVPALLLTWVVDAAGITLFGVSGNVYGGEVEAPQLELPFVPDRLGPGPLAINLAQLQHVFALPEFGSNGPLWSLPYEFWAYLLFPALVVGLVGPGARWARALALLGSALVLLAARRTLCLYFGIWLFGAAVAWWWGRTARSASTRPLAPFALGLVLCGFAAAVAAARLRLLGSRVLEDLALGAATAVLVAALLLRRGAWDRARSSRASTWIASISYTLYLVHYPLIAFVHAATLGRVRLQPSAPAIGAVLAFSLAIVGVWAWPIASVTERHTDKVRAWLEGLVRGRHPALVPARGQSAPPDPGMGDKT